MSIASEITRINNNIASAYTQVSAKGGTLPATQNSSNLANAIASISGGGGSSHDWSVLGYSTEPETISDGYDYAIIIKNNWNEQYKNAPFTDDYKLKYFPSVDFSSITSMEQYFYGSSLEYLPAIDTSNVTNMTYAFSGTKIKTCPNLSSGSSTNVSRMFLNCTLLETAPQMDTNKSKTNTSMFQNCHYLKNVPVYNWSSISNGSTANSNMFDNCPNLTNESLNNIMASCITATKVTTSSYKTLAKLGLTQAQATTCTTLSNYQAFTNAGWTTGY